MHSGILKSAVNTGDASELLSIFSTPLSVISNQPSFVSNSLNLKLNTSSQDVQRWEISAKVVPSNNSSDMLLHTIVNGHSKSFYVRMPQVFGIDVTTDTVTVLGSISASSSIFSIIGATSLVAGEFINFGNHSKVYLVTNAGIAGGGVEVSPPLLVDVPTDTPIVFGEKVTLRAKYGKDTALGITYEDGILSDPGTLTIIEDI